MDATRVEIRHYERTDLPQLGWMQFAVDQQPAAVASIVAERWFAAVQRRKRHRDHHHHHNR